MAPTILAIELVWIEQSSNINKTVMSSQNALNNCRRCWRTVPDGFVSAFEINFEFMVIFLSTLGKIKTPIKDGALLTGHLTSCIGNKG